MRNYYSEIDLTNLSDQHFNNLIDEVSEYCCEELYKVLNSFKCKNKFSVHISRFVEDEDSNSIMLQHISTNDKKRKEEYKNKTVYNFSENSPFNILKNERECKYYSNYNITGNNLFYQCKKYVKNIRLLKGLLSFMESQSEDSKWVEKSSSKYYSEEFDSNFNSIIIVPITINVNNVNKNRPPYQKEGILGYVVCDKPGAFGLYFQHKFGDLKIIQEVMKAYTDNLYNFFEKVKNKIK